MFFKPKKQDKPKTPPMDRAIPLPNYINYRALRNEAEQRLYDDLIAEAQKQLKEGRFDSVGHLAGAINKLR
jgi:hypothetical protein